MLPRRSSKAWPFWKPRMMPIRPLGLGAADVGGVAHQRQQVLVLADHLLHRGDVVHRLGKAFPDRYRAVGRGQAGAAHVLEHGPVPFEMMRPSMTTLSRCRAFMMKSPLWDRGVHGAASCDRTPGRCQAGFGAFFSEGGIRCFPGRTLSCPNTTWTAVVERQASAGRQAGRNGAGSAGIRGVGSRRGCVVARAGRAWDAGAAHGRAGHDRLRNR